MNTNECLLVFLGLSLILVFMFRNYPLCLVGNKKKTKKVKRKKKVTFTNNFPVVGPPQPTREPARMQIVSENFNHNKPQQPGNMLRGAVVMPQFQQGKQNEPTMRYENYSNPNYPLLQKQHKDQQRPILPPPMETNPRKQDMAPLMPQNGTATPQMEVERLSLQNAGTHQESMSGDNFFSSGNLSPANSSEYGSPW
jgi:hypothetical protein